jgi:hypothetical protein
MTLAIGLVNPEGVVMAADSRQSYVRAGLMRVGSDSAIKVFDLTDTVVAATSGYAFLRPQNAATTQNISSLVGDFKPTIAAGSTVHQIATALHAHFATIYAQHIVHFPGEAVPAGDTALQFIVAGYDPSSRVGELFEIDVPGPAPAAAVRTSNNPGPWWIGQNDVAGRIFNGFDGRIHDLPFVQAAHQAGQAPAQLQQLMYIVNWHTMTLQDAIDFVTGMIQITIIIQRYADGIVMQPGGVPGVGGPIDVAVVRPVGPVQWIARKSLEA